MFDEIKTKSSTDIDTAIVRISISGEWDIYMLSAFLHSISILHSVCLLIDIPPIEKRSDYDERIRKNKSIGYEPIVNSVTIDDSVYQLSDSYFLYKPHSIGVEKRFPVIKSIRYNSPGNIEIIGIGSACKSMVLLIREIISLIKHYIPNKIEKVNIEKQKAELLEKKLAILDQVAKSTFYSEFKIKLLNKNSLEVVFKMIENGSIEDIHLVTENKKESE